MNEDAAIALVFVRICRTDGFWCDGWVYTRMKYQPSLDIDSDEWIEVVW